MLNGNGGNKGVERQRLQERDRAEEGETEQRLGRETDGGVIGHHRALGQLFFDILVDTMS